MRALAVLALLSSGCLSSLRFSDTTSEASSRSSEASSGATADAIGPGPSTLVVCGSALVLGAFGAITTTIYEGHVAAQAQVKAEEFRKLHPVQLAPPGPPPPTPLPLPEAPDVLTPPPPPPPISEQQLDSLILARAWLKANRLQLEQDLALGAGPSLEELASLAGIRAEDLAQFGGLLQRNRSRFASSSEPSLEETRRVMASVGELVLADPLLKPDAQAIFAER